jgi:glycosyltransferase involved in cell wall biosynthesis
MFYGRPCIGSRVGGIPELIDHGTTGLLVRPNHVDNLASALTSLIEDRSRRETLGAAAKMAIPAKGMTRQTMLHAYGKMYEEFC